MHEKNQKLGVYVLETNKRFKRRGCTRSFAAELWKIWKTIRALFIDRGDTRLAHMLTWWMNFAGIFNTFENMDLGSCSCWFEGMDEEIKHYKDMCRQNCWWKIYQKPLMHERVRKARVFVCVIRVLAANHHSRFDEDN